MADAELPPESLILQALHAIRKEIAGTNERLDQTNARLEQTNERLDATREELSARIDETNQRLDEFRVFTVQKLTDLNAKVDRLGERMNTLGDRMENVFTGQLGQDVRDLKKRMQAVEERLALPVAHEDPAPDLKKPPDKP